mmetsp:Transcript_74922/g.132513  ORF Transcript_74922/g.132513 Transcript_74922/m.132513 type:complete len:494 (-) Transcript_74922:75-1556(-)
MAMQKSMVLALQLLLLLHPGRAETQHCPHSECPAQGTDRVDFLQNRIMAEADDGTAATAALDVAKGEVEDHSPVALEAMVRSQWQALEHQYAPAAKSLLQQAANGSFKPTSAGESAVFEAVQVALPLEPPILSYKEGTGAGQAQKNIAGLTSLRQRAQNGRPCIVYGLGIADDSGFEESMATTGCETHAFDCTVDPLSEVVSNQKHFKFHQWCVGRAPAASQNEKENVYVNSLVHVESTLPCETCNKKVEIVSAGPAQKVASKILIDGQEIAFKPARGINLIAIDPATQQVVSNSTYDTYIAAEKENARLASDLYSLPTGQIVLVAVHDTGLEHLRQNALEALHHLGASVDGGNFREGYAFIGRVGQQPVVEKRSRDIKHQLQFKSLAETMQELGHTHVDLLKFDIEGYEWQLFQSEILSTNDRTQLPEQIAFELHTRGANPSYVPVELVSSKGPEQVGDLFLSLFDIGYRVISKEINSGDGHCAEFVALRVN